MRYLKLPVHFMGLFFLIIISLSANQACAIITGALGTVDSYNQTICYPTQVVPYFNHPIQFTPICTITDVPANVYVPKSGMYKLHAELTFGYGWGEGNSFYVDANIPIAQQQLHDGGYDYMGSSPGYWHAPVTICYYFVSVETGQKYTIPGAGWSCQDSGSIPLPPTPPAPEVNCHINNDVNALNVNFPTIERSAIPVVPKSGEIIHKTIPVTCTGGKASFNMVFNYTPLTVNGTDVIQTSTDGVGVTLIYNNSAIPPTTVTSLAFPEGANTIDLGFEIVRNSSINIKDIATGAFSASAVMVLTQM